ncbi:MULTISPECIES: DUF1120 domain-containing protein [unclassified Pseudomonas]|uniref:DUF1120 domain-containing protein n=1 Tax=unclassified Pseudomonas TaxID=196821 RepID=UPI002AC955F4|nr:MULTISPECIES: DUF1120 domain-containing protein [unclassified Pseudomonas]MEB0044370.1 DUF1120 domain-containing protein [Pseudomonas sp. Dout3]MEB0094693.1 DUF1120 domain-containing protein [Pseudomonas sp. DC1.2]WPX59939.1 DUF1120 domain-containing protein [Pseudomonas sp. DC1.2]
MPLTHCKYPSTNSPSSLAALLLGLMLPMPAFSANGQTDLIINGLVTPSACRVDLNGGEVDHGRIPARDLLPDEFSVLPSQMLTMQINCSAPVLFALVGIDNRADSSLAPNFFYGLGKNVHASAERLGSVSLSFRNSSGDGQTMQSLTSYDQGLNWSPEPNAYPRMLMGFARPGRPQPEPIINLTTQLRVDTSISPARTLTLQQEVPLDGSIVLDLRYL